MKKLAALAVLGAGVLATGVAAAAPSTPSTPSTPSKPSTVNFKIVEWDFLPTTATKTAPAKITFVVRNAGNLTHEFVVLKTVKSAGTLAPSGAAEAPETGAVGEIGEIKPGAVKRLTLQLKKGHYSLICNLTGHYNNGQFVDFYVRTP
jgi:uncharacterized cupredoxin-like copper-binding protein